MEMKLDDLYKVASSKRVLKSDWKSEGIPFYRGREISSLSKYGYVENDLYITEEMYKDFTTNYGVPVANDIMVTAIGTIGNTYIVKNKDKFYFKDASVLWLKKEKEVDSKFVNYWFKSTLFTNQLDVGLGATVDTLTIGKVQSLKINVPPVATQKKIVAKLDAIFAEIDKAKSAAETNVKNAESLFLSYLNKIFNSDFIHYKEYKLGEVCTFQGGSQPAKSFFEYELNNENIRFIQIRDYKSDKNLVYIPKKLAKRHCDETDVMIGRYGPPVFQILKGIKGSYNVALMKAIPKEKMLTKDYLFYFLKNPLIQDYVISLSNRAAGQSGMNKETIEPYEIHLPKIDEQNIAIKMIESCYEYSEKIIYTNKLKIENLNFLKQSILKQAFSGELVKE
jgi:type I restriction enzyme S subunit